MNYLLDTCVISELINKNPDPNVIQWITEAEESRLFISVLTIGEFYKGVAKLPKSKKKEKLYEWVKYDLEKRFNDRIRNFDFQSAAIWGKIQAQSKLSGKAMPAIDGMIAATGIAYNLTVVTRNTTDMEVSGVALFNPW